MQEDEPDAPSPSPDARPHSSRTPLAARLVQFAQDSGQPVSAILRERRINRHTWYAILDGRIPLETTIVQIADALGLKRAELLELAGYAPAAVPQAPQPRPGPTRTPLGDVLHKARVESGQTVSGYCNERGISRSTWHRVVDRGDVPRESTVVALARKTGLDAEDLRRRSGYLAAGAAQPAD